MDKQPKLHFKHIMRIMQVEKFLRTWGKVYIFITLCLHIPLVYFNCPLFTNVRILLIDTIITTIIYVVRFILLMIRIHLMKLDIENTKSIDIEIQDILKVMESQAKENNEEKEDD